MSSVNEVTLIGRAGNDPVVKTFPNGNEYCYFSLATTETWKNKSTGEPMKDTTWHRVMVYVSGLVQVVERYVKKGSLIYIRGSIEKREYTDQSGAVQRTTDIAMRYGSSLRLLSPKNDGETDPYERQEPAPQSMIPKEPARAATKEWVDDDPIPF